ncbi:hypothetical protein [Pseudoclavibacter endophyticus]|uniref:Uncharacterized protein n=1 Tax=Pseudoclavibacter endophyticus TaxID=1778590 RepID=A0A6H9WLL1_9MICO|nr:hypothetical protein [Pseudoclavibacter endophyticus]KAB1646802.1 hypothetical protein F8O04_13785 [Pseudoclavibacter endophyticus]
MIELIAAAEEGHHVVNELFMPPFMFGVLAFAILMLLTVLTFLFRNTQHSHPEASAVSPYTPYVHPGHDTDE